MTSLQQAHSPYPGLQHQGVPQGYMAGMPHTQGQQGQPGPGMPQQMHMGVSGPGGPQVTQAGAMMAGMPPGAGGPNAHALQHLNPTQQQQAALFQQQQQQQQQAMSTSYYFLSQFSPFPLFFQSMLHVYILYLVLHLISC